MANNKYASLAVFLTLAIGQSGGIYATTTHESRIAFKPSWSYMEYRNRLLNEPSRSGGHLEYLNEMLLDLEDAASNHLDLGEFETDRGFIASVLDAAKPKASRCVDGSMVPNFIEEIRLQMRSAFNIHEDFLGPYLETCLRAQREFCRNITKDLNKQRDEISTNQRFKKALEKFENHGAELQSLAAVNDILNVVYRVGMSYGGRLLPEYAAIRDKYQPLRDMMLFDKKKCDTILDRIAALRREHSHIRKSLFDHWQREHIKYCKAQEGLRGI